jgi:hypothetical protein
MNHTFVFTSVAVWAPPDLVRLTGSTVSLTDYEPYIDHGSYFSAVSNPLVALAILHYHNGGRASPNTAVAWPFGGVGCRNSFGKTIMAVCGMHKNANLDSFGVRSRQVMCFNHKGGVFESEVCNEFLNGLIQFLPAAVAEDSESYQRHAHLFDTPKHTASSLLSVPPYRMKLDSEREIESGKMDLFLSAALPPSDFGSGLLPVLVVEVAVEPALEKKHVQGLHYSADVIHGSTDCPVVHITIVTDKIKASLVFGRVPGQYTIIDLIEDWLTEESLNCLLQLIAFFCRFLPALYVQRKGKVTSSMTFHHGTQFVVEITVCFVIDVFCFCCDQPAA